MAAVSRRLRPARHVPPHSVGQRAARQLRGVLPDGQPRTYALQLLRPASDDELTRIRSNWERAMPGCSLVIITSDMRPGRPMPPHSVGRRAARQLHGVQRLGGVLRELPDGQPRTYALQLLRPASDDELTRIRSSWERALPGCSLVIITSDMRLTVACSPQERSALLRRLVSWRLAGEVTFLDDAIRGGYEALAEWRSAMR